MSPIVLEVRHDVADGGGRKRARQDAAHIARADRLAGVEIGLDDAAEDLARAIVECGKPVGAHVDSALLLPVPDIETPREDGKCPLYPRRRHVVTRPARPINVPDWSPMRPSERALDELRRVTLERGISKHAEGSCLVRFGDTHVLCTASLAEQVPGWLRGGGKGWVTAEYGMLPRATHERMRREATARPAGRPHAGDPAPDRPLAARRRRPEGARRAADHRRLRRAAGRRRHAHRRDHRRLGGAARCARSGCARAT